MSEEQTLKRMLKGRLFSRRRKGQPHTRWLDNVVTDRVVMRVRGWRRRVEDRVVWRRVVKNPKPTKGCSAAAAAAAADVDDDDANVYFH
jgi:CTP:molybdopterin cytidylyltransferase MocA